MDKVIHTLKNGARTLEMDKFYLIDIALLIRSNQCRKVLFFQNSVTPKVFFLPSSQKMPRMVTLTDGSSTFYIT